MCGIAGGMTKTGHPPSGDALSTMQHALMHRGPDGQGRFDAAATALVHTRLAIIDPEHGKQPFVTNEGYALVANGEIYNDLSIRDDLTDGPYQTGSDNESALHLYRRYGLEFVNHLRGMYALAVYDPSKSQLILARDPFGIKPLYFAETDDAFWFASELQALLAADAVPRHENVKATDQLLALQFTCGSQTAIQGVSRLNPGEVIVVQEGRITDRFTTAPISQFKEPSNDSVQHFDRLWLDSIDVHRRSDVPYGIFLSSGTDSAAVLTAMARLENRPVIAFTAGFGGTHVHDERDHASQLAKKTGAEHHAIEIGSDDFWQHLPKIVTSLDDPVADYAAVPTYLLGKEAAKSVKVVLTGEGGDEIFAGYGRYRSGRRPWPFRRKAWARHALARSGVLRNQTANWRKDIQATEQSLLEQEFTPLQRRAGSRYCSLVAQRPAYQSRPLPDGSWCGRPGSVSRWTPGKLWLRPGRSRQDPWSAG